MGSGPMVEASSHRSVAMVMCGEARRAPVAAANYLARLRQRPGITIRGIIDVIVATWCIENRVQLLHSDRDFAYFERHLDLAVWR